MLAVLRQGETYHALTEAGPCLRRRVRRKQGAANLPTFSGLMSRSEWLESCQLSWARESTHVLRPDQQLIALLSLSADYAR